MTIKATDDYLHEVIAVFERFEKYSGFKVNYYNTETIHIGRLKNSQLKLNTSKNIKWTSEPVRLVGILITKYIQNSNTN